MLADTAQLRRSEADALALHHQQLAETLGCFGDGIITVDHEARVVFMNEAAERLTACAMASARAALLDVVLRLVREGTGEPLVYRATELEAPAVRRGRAELIAVDGRRLVVDHAAFVVRDARGEPLGLSIALRDVTEIQRTALRQDLLARVGIELLESALEYDERLRILLKLVVPAFADWAAVDVVTLDGGLQRVAVAHREPHKAKLLAELVEPGTSASDLLGSVEDVILTGRPMLRSAICEEDLNTSVPCPRGRASIRALSVHSYMRVPLIARGRTLGAVTFGSSRSDLSYHEDDLRFAEELAARAALALENANLYRDAQQQKHAAEQAEAQLRVLTHSIPQIIWASTPEDEIEFLSERWYEFTGQSADESLTMAGRYVAVHPEDRERVHAAIEDGKRTERPWEIDYRLRRKDGVYRWFLSRGVPMFDGAGKLVRWYGTATDIDEQKTAIRTRDELLATVSHDLRNPLGNVLMATSILKASFSGNDPESARVRKQLAVLERAGRRMDTLIRDLLDIAAIESGHLSVSLKAEGVSALLAEVLESALPKAREKKIHLDAASDSRALTVDCDRERILQVFENLMSNAFRFTPPDGLITISVEQHDQDLCFSVSDTGSGIPPDQLPHIFDRFWHAGGVGKRAGTGLGLAICQGLVELHGGRIWARSELSRGTTVTFSLPLRKES